jgi:competence protein ComEA
MDHPAATEKKTPLIDINAASVEELTELPRIGEVVAKRIIEYRENNGPFSSVEEIMGVRGIGEKVFEQIKDLIQVKEKRSGKKKKN